jgi:hypothetical protein
MWKFFIVGIERLPIRAARLRNAPYSFDLQFLLAVS